MGGRFVWGWVGARAQRWTRKLSWVPAGRQEGDRDGASSGAAGCEGPGRGCGAPGPACALTQRLRGAGKLREDEHAGVVALARHILV